MAEETQVESAEQQETEAQKLARENAELKAALQSANSRAATAERSVTEYQNKNLTSEQRRLKAEQEANQTALEALTSEADQIEAQIAAFSDEPGHGKEIAALNRKLANNAAQARDLENRKLYLENQAKTATATPTAPQGRVLADSKTAVTAFSAEDQQWLDAHPRAFTDRAYLAKVFAAAQAATQLEGLTERTPEYYRYIEERVEGTSPRATQQTQRQQVATPESPFSNVEDEGEDLYAVKAPQKPAAGPGAIRAAASAAPSRTQPGTMVAAGRRVAALTPDEREVADSIYGDILDPRERYKKYATNKEWIKTSHRFGAN